MLFLLKILKVNLDLRSQLILRLIHKGVMMRQFTIFLIFLSFSYGVELKIGSVMPKKELKLIIS